MRTLSATLKAAQRVSPQRPRVSLIVRDKQLRPVQEGLQALTNAQTDMCVSSDGNTIVIAALTLLGDIWIRRVTDATQMGSGSGWGHWDGDWTMITAPHSPLIPGEALPWGNGGDVAISENSGTIRVFFIATGESDIYSMYSDDDGATWSAKESVKAALGGSTDTYWLAADGNDNCFWASTIDNMVHRRARSGGAWGSEQDLGDLVSESGTFEECGGIGAEWYDGSCLVVGGFWATGVTAGELRVVWYDPSAGAGSRLSAARTIVPFGNTLDGFQPWWPHVAQYDTAEFVHRFLLTYLDKFSSGGTDYLRGVARRSRGDDHWSGEVPLGMTQTYETRMPSCAFDSKVYVHQLNEAYRLRHYNASDSETHLEVTQQEILRYRIYERPNDGELVAELDNRDGTYDNPGTEGVSAECLRGLASVYADQGLKTAGGDEKVECRPFLIWSVANERSKYSNLARMRAVDAWQLFRLWQPRTEFFFADESLEFVIGEVACRVGFFEVETDGEPEWSYGLSTRSYPGSAMDWDRYERERYLDRTAALSPESDEVLSLTSQQSGFRFIMRLLGLVGGAARWGNGDSVEKLYLFIPEAQGDSPSADHVYTDGENVETMAIWSVQWPTFVWASDGSTTKQGTVDAGEGDIGISLKRSVANEEWDTGARLTSMADSVLDDAAARSLGGYIITRPNVGLELFDVITWSDSRMGGGYSSVKRRVNGLLVEYVPGNRVWRQKVYLEGV